MPYVLGVHSAVKCSPVVNSLDMDSNRPTLAYSRASRLVHGLDMTLYRLRGGYRLLMKCAHMGGTTDLLGVGSVAVLRPCMSSPSDTVTY